MPKIEFFGGKLKFGSKNNFCKKIDPKWLKFGKKAFFGFARLGGLARARGPRGQLYYKPEF